jgi:acetyl-CoA carboxylase biotin carboxyl carrier protein
MRGEELELIAEERDGALHLCSPGVGWLTCASRRGEVLVPGTSAGVLKTLGRFQRLLVPAGVGGRVSNDVPERIHEPVDHRRSLYVLEPIGAAEEAVARAAAEAGATGELVVRAAQSGRFWHRPTPNDPAYCEVGTVLETGTAVGLIEVMKTFATVPYAADGGLPARARVVRVLVPDGGEVERGTPLVEVEPA